MKTGSATLNNWALVNRASNASVSCSVNEQAWTVTCPLLEQAVGIFAGSALTLDLKASAFVPAGTHDAIIETSLSSAGTPESLGSIEWTDESGVFRWIEGTSPLVKSTRLQS
jgi:hypothetical protein